MTEPITPPLELVQQWGHNANLSGVPHNDEHWAYEQHIATCAAQWGADQELEACRMEIIEGAGLFYIDGTSDRVRLAEDIWTARRPKPPSLKEQALAALKHAPGPDYPNPITLLTADQHALIRRALEALND
jgi:hypothetical protein